MVRILECGLAVICGRRPPDYSAGLPARDIFEIKDPDATKLVLEIGFGDLALATPAIASIYFPEWMPALALAGAIFFGLAGLQHVRNKASSRSEIAAMISDLGLAAVLIVYLLWLASLGGL